MKNIEEGTANSRASRFTRRSRTYVVKRVKRIAQAREYLTGKGERGRGRIGDKMCMCAFVCECICICWMPGGSA